MARLTLATLATALVAGVSAQNWMTSHHDNRNSGQSELIGPAERNGTCEAPIIGGSALKNSPNFWNTGVLSATNEYLFVGDSDNVVNLVETEKFFVYWLNLSALAAQPYNPVTNYGIVEAGSNHRILVGGQQPIDPTKDSSLVWTDRLYVPSGDGSVYALNPLQCNAPPAPSSAVKAKLSAQQLSATQAKHNAVLEASRAALKPSASDPTLHQTDLTVYRQVLTEKLGAVSGATADEINSLTASPCPVWQKSFAGAVYAPLRYVSPSPDYPQYVEGVVIASETDVGLDAGGVLHGIDAHSGALIWSIPALYYDKDGVTQVQAGIRTVPAVTPFLTTAFNASAPGAPASGYNQTYIAFFAFGTRVIAVDSFTGRIAGDINTTLIQQQNPNGPSGGGVTGTDLFVSSPTLTTQGAAMFMHSSLGTLWKLAISGYDTYANNGKIAMTFIFACDYTLTKDGASRTICDAIAASTSEEGKMVLTSNERSKARLAAVNNNAAALDVVSGGFYQPTTRQDRDQLYQLLLDEYVKAGLQRDDEKKNPLTVATMTAKDASRIMRALPYETVASLKTASGYQLLAPNSRPVSSMLELDRTTTLGKRQLALDAKAVVGLTPTQRRQLALELGQKAISEGTSAVGSSVSLANKYGFLGAFPFATPSIQPPNDAVIVVAQYGAFGLDSALFAANSYDGSLKWGLVNVTSPDGRKIAFGKSRSSPAIDAAGNVYAGTDSDDGPYTLPMVIATDPNGKFQWLNALDTDNVAVGQSSPIVAAGFLAEKRTYMSTGYGLQAIDEGYACPGALDPFTPCSGNGVCNCAVGLCTCSNKCYSGPACSVAKQCGATGSCNPMTGECVCSDPCFTGPNCDQPRNCGNGQCISGAGGCVCNNCWLEDKTGSCTVPNTCHGRGTCSHFTGQCKCTDSFCYSGNNCEMVNPCGGHGTCGNSTCSCFPNYSTQNSCQTCDACHSGFTSGCVTLTNDCSGNGVCNPSSGACICNAGYGGDSCSSKTGGNGGAVAAGILIPTILLGLGGALFYWKRKNPHKAFSDLVPSTSGIFNFGRTKYTKMTATSTSSSSMGSPGLSSGFISRQSSARGGGSTGNTGSELASYGGGRASLKASTGGGYGSYGT